MKRTISLLTAIVMCICLAAPVCAETFVPSITDKNAPDLVVTPDNNGNKVVGEVEDENGEFIDHVYEECIVITPVSQAEESDKIPEAAKEQLLSLYEQLSEGTMTLPYDKISEDLDPDHMVIRDMVDISWLCDDHPEIVGAPGVTLTLTFDLGVSANTDVYVMHYYNGEWIPAVSVVNNGNGTVSVTLEDVGPVVFSVRTGTDSKPSETGDAMDLTLWVTLLAISAVALAAVVFFRRKFV